MLRLNFVDDVHNLFFDVDAAKKICTPHSIAMMSDTNTKFACLKSLNDERP